MNPAADSLARPTFPSPPRSIPPRRHTRINTLTTRSPTRRVGKRRPTERESKPHTFGSYSQVKDRVFSERVRIQDFFIDFDKKRTGNVSKTQFVSAMSIAGFRLTSLQVHELCEQYPSDAADKPVRWRDFCDDVNAVFAPARLEKTPGALVPQSSRKSLDCDPLRHSSSRSIKSEDLKFLKNDLDRTVSELSGSTVAGDATERLLDAIEERVRARYVDVAPLFRDHNKNPNSPKRVNSVTATQFAAVLKTHIRPGLTEEETALLVEHFGDGSGMVNYARFAATVDPKHAKPF